MTKRSNSSLKNFYEGVYKKGERGHYTQFRLQQGDLPEEFAAVLHLVSWKDKDVLDAGCGTGDMCGMIADAEAKSVVGADYSEKAIAEARQKYTRPNLTFTCGDFASIQGTFDTIISLGTLEHTDDPLATLKLLKKKLKKGGDMVITCPNWLNPRGYILQTLWQMFRAPITLADLHYLTPLDFVEWSQELCMDLRWFTVDHEWGGGKKMVKDFERRLPNVSRDAGWTVSKEQIDEFLRWLDTRAVPFLEENEHGGAVGVYHLTQKA